MTNDSQKPTLPRTLNRNAMEDLTGWLTCNEANKFEKIGGLYTQKPSTK
jgi:hypothetical protein